MSPEHAVIALLVGAEPELAELVEELQTPPDPFDGLDLLSHTRHGPGGPLATKPTHHDPRNKDGTAVSMSLNGLIEYVVLPVWSTMPIVHPSFLFDQELLNAR